MGVFKVTIPELTQCNFSISQPEDSGNRYSPVSIHMFKIDEKGFNEGIYEAALFASVGNYKDGFVFKGAARDTFIDKYCCEFAAGDYYLIAEVDWVEGNKDKSFVLNCYSKGAVTAQDATDSVSVGSIFAKWAETNLRDALANIEEGEEVDEMNLLSWDWGHKSKYVNGPNQYENTTEGGIRTILINNVKGHGSWIVTSEIKDS